MDLGVLRSHAAQVLGGCCCTARVTPYIHMGALSLTTQWRPVPFFGMNFACYIGHMSYGIRDLIHLIILVNHLHAFFRDSLESGPPAVNLTTSSGNSTSVTTAYGVAASTPLLACSTDTNRTVGTQKCYHG